MTFKIYAINDIYSSGIVYSTPSPPLMITKEGALFDIFSPYAHYRKIIRNRFNYFDEFFVNSKIELNFQKQIGRKYGASISHK